MPKRGSCGSVLPGCRLSKQYPSINSPAVRCCTSRARRDAHRTLLNSPVSDIARRLVPASRLPSRAAPALNPHSARCLAGAQLPATSCLGAFRPPATSSCGGSRDPGVRKPAHFRKWPGSFDHLIGAANQCEGRLYAERLQRLQIYEELHFCRKLNGQIGWLFAA